MYLTHFIYIIASSAATLKCNAKEDNLSISSLSGSTATHHLQHSDLNVGQEEESMKQKAQRTLHVTGTRLLQVFNFFIEGHTDCPTPVPTPDTGTDDTDGTSSPTPVPTPVPTPDTGTDDTDGTSSPTPVPTPVPIICTSLSPSFYMDKKIYASDIYAAFGVACATKDDSIVLGAPYDSGGVGAAYLFNRCGTNEVKLTPGVDSVGNDYFGISISMDEKIVVGTGNYVNYIRVYSREGIYENTITCSDCETLGSKVATLGNKILANAKMNDNTYRLFIYNIEGVKLKELEFPFKVTDIAISELFIVAQVQDGKVYIYSNSAPDFPLVTEVDLEANTVAVSNDRVVIRHRWNNAAWLYRIDGSLIKELDHDAPENFGQSIDITDDKVYVGSPETNSIWIYSAATGDFIEEITPPDGEESIRFGSSVCVSESFYVVGAPSARDDNDVTIGAAYLINFPL